MAMRNGRAMLARKRGITSPGFYLNLQIFKIFIFSIQYLGRYEYFCVCKRSECSGIISLQSACQI